MFFKYTLLIGYWIVPFLVIGLLFNQDNWSLEIDLMSIEKKFLSLGFKISLYMMQLAFVNPKFC